MKEFDSLHQLRAHLHAARSGGQRIALVPTMGALHEGHLSLVDEARRRAECIVLSIFVNPLQFGPAEDFERYPRDLKRDRAVAAERGVGVLFAPAVTEMFPPWSQTRVVPGLAGSRWEGEMRPGHFGGVLTVVAKLFHLVTPSVAVFGQKDIQQATLIRHMVRDLDWPIEIVVPPIVREPDGLALSSRNAYLKPEERRQGLGLNRALRAAERAWEAGERAARVLEGVMRRELEPLVGLALDYIAVVDPEQFEPVLITEPGTVIAVAGRVGSTRLLDNVILGQGGG